MGIPERADGKGGGAREGSDYGSNLRISVCATQGGRKYMEDRVHIHCERKDNGEVDYVFLGVYDGHGGSEASEFARQNLLWSIVEQKGFHSDNDEQVLQAIQEGFLQTHHAMRKVVDQWARTASGFTSTSGTTASIAFIRRGKVYTGHVGDSAIVMGVRNPKSGNIEGKQLTVDHKPDSPEELERINRTGGEVMNKAGVMRVVWTRPVRGHSGPVRRSTTQEKVPFLAVARALGDLWSYNSAADDYVVSPDPDVGVFELTKETCCLVLGSDGLWNVIRPQYCIDIVNSHEWKEANMKNMDESPSHGNDGSVDSFSLDNIQANHSKWLVRHGLRGWGCLRADNITAVTVIIDPPSTQISPTSKVLEMDDPSLDISHLFTEAPESMIRVCPETCQVLTTEPVELIYGGAMDPPLSNMLLQGISVGSQFSGPGFTSYSIVPTPKRINMGKRPSTNVLYGGPAKRPAPSSPANGASPSNKRSSLTIASSRSEANTESDVKSLRKEQLISPHSTDAESVPQQTAPVPSQTAASNGDKSPHQVSRKPKYVCRKHGLSCEKVKNLNAKVQQQGALKTQTKVAPDSGSTADAETSDVKEKASLSKQRSNKDEELDSCSTNSSDSSVCHNTRLRSGAFASGGKIGLNVSRRKSISSLRSRSGGSSFRRSRSAESRPRIIGASPILSPATPKSSSPRVVTMSLDRPATHRKSKKRFAHFSIDIGRSNHLFRVRNLRNCLGKNSSFDEIKTDSKPIKKHANTTKTRPRSAMSGYSSMPGPEPRSMSELKMTNDPGDFPRYISQDVVDEKECDPQERDSEFMRSNVSPRFLRRSPIHPLPFLDSRSVLPPTNQVIGAEPDPDVGKVMKRKLFGSDNGHSNLPDSLEPPVKKNRIWASIMNIFGGSHAQTTIVPSSGNPT